MVKSKKYVLCIVGSRDIYDYSLIEKSMKMHGIQLEDIKEIISGGAKGVDSNAKKFAEFNKIKFKEYPAKWDDLKAKDALIKQGQYGKYNAKAGFDRNKTMAEKADKLLAITNGSNGTDHMIKSMKELGKEVFVYEVDSPNKNDNSEKVDKDLYKF
jgi:DNA-binding transcriptional MerR regulator